MAAHHGNTSLVLGTIHAIFRVQNGTHVFALGAMGCGVYFCPPRQVAEEMRAILLEPEFKGWFRDIVFAVYVTSGNPNFEIFSEVFSDVEV